MMDEGDYDYLRGLGIGLDVLESAEPDPVTGIALSFSPETVRQRPAEVLAAIAAGVGVIFVPTRPAPTPLASSRQSIEYDLAFLAPVIGCARSLTFLGHVARYANISVLAGLSDVENVLLPRGSSDLDFSHLTRLRFASVSAEHGSVLALPGLERLYLDGRVPRALRPVAAPLQVLHAEFGSGGGLPHLGFLGDVSRLRELRLVGRGQLDLSPLRDARSLEHIFLVGYRELTGMRALASIPSLRRLWLEEVRKIDDRDAILEMPISDLSAERNHLFDDRFQRQLRSRNPSASLNLGTLRLV